MNNVTTNLTLRAFQWNNMGYVVKTKHTNQAANIISANKTGYVDKFITYKFQKVENLNGKLKNPSE